MARWVGADAVYDAAELFRQRCLTSGQSLLWPEYRSWSVATIDALVDAFTGRADYGEGSFLDKLHDQLAEEPDDVVRVAADILAFYFLFPSSNTVGRKRKLESIQTIVDWRPEILAIAPDERGMLEAAFAEGIGSTGPDYLSGRPWHLVFLLAFARGVIEGQADPFDPASCRRLIDALGLQLKGRTQARHVLLHLLFPNQFERTASEAHKKKIVAAFQKDAGGAPDPDDALANIRRALAERLGRDDLDFYLPDIRDLWDTTTSPPGPEAEAVAAIRAAVETMYPDPAVRRTCLTVFADAIERAHATSPASWAVSMPPGKNDIRFNVLWTQPCILSTGDLRLIVDRGALDESARDQMEAIFAADPRNGAAYPTMKFAAPFGVHLSIGHLAELLPLVRKAYLHFVTTCAGRVKSRVHRYQEHVPAVVDYLRDELGRDLPQPNYGSSPPVSQQAWLFQANPAVWNLTEELRDRAAGDDGTWSVSRFHTEMGPGQPVVLWQGGKDAGIYALGELIDGPFERPTAEFWPDREERSETEWAVPFVYTRILDRPLFKVELLTDPVLKDLWVIRGPMGTNFKLTPEQWAAVQNLLAAWPSPQPPTLDDLAARTHLDRAELAELEDLLLEKRQLVLEGPPGSGKTYLAELFARYVVGVPLEGDPDERVETVQFHQSYGYEDFVQGIRPVTDEQGQLQYHVLPGIFMRICDLAARNPEKRFVLIIDEINRGNLSRIFGELLLLLEYRDKRVRLPYGAVDGKNEQAYLTIPSNLYLIGTMNSTDRSLALIDYALRRRFYFYRLLPVRNGSAPVLARWLAAKEMNPDDQQRVLDVFVALNSQVDHHLSAEYQIGHSYFMHEDIGSEAGLARVWRRAILPLLEEYFHGARDREAILAELTPAQLLPPSAPEPDSAPVAISAEEI